MLTSPTNIRERGRMAAEYIRLATQSINEARTEYSILPGSGRTLAILKAAGCHAEAAKNLDGAIEILRELY